MLPQLTVYAKIIYLLMVVISGALCTVEDYVIMSQCAHNKAIHLAAEGTVSVTDISKTQNITIVGLPDYVNNDFKITLYAKETQRYLCFNENWKLVGMREIQETCYFNETIVHGYFVFRSVIDLQRRVGFTHRGKAIGPKKNVTDACYLFTKIHAEQFFHQHTHHNAPKTKTTTRTTTATVGTAPTRLATAAADATSTLTTANKSKVARNKHNNNNINSRNKTNGMRNNNNNNSNTNQNRQNYPGHNSNISNNSNINLSSIKEQQQQLNVSNTPTHQQRHHQVRHHHNDPNVVARRHQHEHKPRQKQRRQRMRARATASPTTTINSIATTAEGQFYSQSAGVATTIAGSNKTLQSKKAAKATPSTTTTATTHVQPTRMRTATTTITTTTVANKRKGRRRKADRMHKNKQQQQQNLQQLQQLPANAKDPQHRQPYRAEPTSATRRLWTTTQIDVQEAENSSVASAPSSSSAYDFTLTSDWSSPEPVESTVKTEFAASPTSPTLASSSYWPATATVDFDASSPAFATISEENLAAEAYATMLSNMMTDNLDAASLPDDVGATSPAEADRLNDANNAKPTAPTSYEIANSWTAGSSLDEATTLLEGKPTPILSTLNTAPNELLWSLTTDEDTEATESTIGTLADNSSSSSDLSSAATEELLYSEATAETSTTFDEENDNDDVLTTSQSKLSRFPTNDITDNIIVSSHKEKHFGHSNIVAKPYLGSTTAIFADIAPTLATMMQQKLLRATTRDYKTKPDDALSTEASLSSSGSSIESNNFNHSLTDYAFSTKTSNIHNKQHINRQQKHSQHPKLQQPAATSSNSSPTAKNLSFNSNKNKNTYSTKLNRNKFYSKAGAGTTVATYLSAADALAAFATQNHREMLFADIQQEEQDAAEEEVAAAEIFHHNHSLISINKNINNQQNNNTLLGDFDSNSSSFPRSYIAATPTLAKTASTSTTSTSSSSSSSSSISTSPSLAATTTTTKKHFRKSTQKLMATPFHQLTAYVRNHAGDIDIDNMDNISVYPDLLDVDVVHGNGSSETGANDNFMNASNSRMTIVSGYLPTSATATLPESIRIAKIKINKERKRMLRQRLGGSGGRYA